MGFLGGGGGGGGGGGRGNNRALLAPVDKMDTLGKKESRFCTVGL